MNDSPLISIQAPPLPYYLECGKSVYQPGWQHPSRTGLGIFDLLIVVSGVLHMGEGDRKWTLLPGQTLLLSPDGYHYSAQPCEEETVFYWIHFQIMGEWEELQPLSSMKQSGLMSKATDAFPYVNRSAIAIPKSCFIRDAQDLYRSVERLLELSVETRSVAFWQEQQLFLELLRRMDQGSSADQASQVAALAGRTEAFLKQNYRKDLTNVSLSDALHFHPNYITRCMKQCYGCTPMEFLAAYRIEQAKLLLLKTEWSVAEIAEQVGFRYTPYFTSCFKKQVGVTPLRFRKQFSM
ncbi:helix-turn-helix domain-containing protein [Paenibacillus puerhi]|uniref:helix-turn-helix domain-containing protein n=1 Tax=Paenibacillus puerhi TaxID=2692622 RepID=UPI00135B03F2|nr:AraC family transcriptional regulator [Paenibacillus puerhi]